MKPLLAILLLVMCGLALASPQMQNVGDEFGKTWLVENADKYAPPTTGSDLWNWGGNPLGYEVQNGKIYPVLAPSQWYYPTFMSNSTPLLVNGTAFLKNQIYVRPDFISPDYASDPWYLAQIMERPVIVTYPAPVGRSTLL